MFDILSHAIRTNLTADALPKELQGVFKAMQAKRRRQGNRSVKRFMKARAYLLVALAGGGAREVARRARQIAANQLEQPCLH